MKNKSLRSVPLELDIDKNETEVPYGSGIPNRTIAILILETYFVPMVLFLFFAIFVKRTNPKSEILIPSKDVCSSYIMEFENISHFHRSIVIQSQPVIKTGTNIKSFNITMFLMIFFNKYNDLIDYSEKEITLHSQKPLNIHHRSTEDINMIILNGTICFDNTNISGLVIRIKTIDPIVSHFLNQFAFYSFIVSSILFVVFVVQTNFSVNHFHEFSQHISITVTLFISSIYFCSLTFTDTVHIFESERFRYVLSSILTSSIIFMISIIYTSGLESYIGLFFIIYLISKLIEANPVSAILTFVFGFFSLVLMNSSPFEEFFLPTNSILIDIYVFLFIIVIFLSNIFQSSVFFTSYKVIEIVFLQSITIIQLLQTQDHRRLGYIDVEDNNPGSLIDEE